MLQSVQYTLRTQSLTNELLNAEATYDVSYDSSQGIAYDVVLRSPSAGADSELVTEWHARIVNRINQERLEYDLIKKIYYRSRQTILVESALFKLQEDLLKFLGAEGTTGAESIQINGQSYPGFRQNTLTIWIDPVNFLPMHRENLDRGNVIRDEFAYTSINQPLPAILFDLPKPEEAIADFDLYPEPPILPLFTCVTEQPVAGVYVGVLIEEIKRQIIQNEWEYGPFSTIKLPWQTDMAVRVYRGRTPDIVPPLVVMLEVPGQGRVYFTVSYSYLGYVVSGFTPDSYDLTQYEELPIRAVLRLEDFVPIYAAPSPEKDFVVANFIKSVQSNDYFINAFNMGGKAFEMLIKNFNFNENEGYLLMDVYGKEYWDNANTEAKFNYVVTGQMADAHTTPTMIYALNSMKRLGIHKEVQMPVYRQVAGS